jgi:hypothetical protein
MQPGWIPQVFTTTEMGVSTAYSPELIPDNQLVWLKNGVIRGGKPHPRPGFIERLILPSGPIQGAQFFSVQNGMIVAQIYGHLYRIRINNTSFAWEEVTLDWANSSALPYAWMQETVGFMVIQDGQSDPIIYNGSTARRSDPASNEVPRGKMMAYGNGRLWVAIDDNDIVAGDIKTNVSGSELLFTETQYFTGGGAFYFPFTINAMGFIPASGASGYGSLLILGKDQTHGVRADISSRDQWATFPGFIQPILLNTGASSHFSLAEVNQDLYWRDGEGGVRSIRSAASDEVNGPGNVPISREIARLTDYESENRLDGVSAIHFDNRLIMTASPFIDKYGHTAYRSIFSLDFSPISSNSNKAPPAYDGQWEGLYFKRLVNGLFRGKRRAFALVTDDQGTNRLWEFDETVGGDNYTDCSKSVRSFPMVLEYPARNWGDPKRRKRIERCDVYLSSIKGEVEIAVYWRADNYQKWTAWDSTADICATMTDAGVDSPHIFKNLAAQDRSQIMTFSPPNGINSISFRGLNVGFMHQLRVVVTGNATVYKTVAFASMLEEEQYPDRDSAFGDCVQEDITGNEIIYEISTQHVPQWLMGVQVEKWDHNGNDSGSVYNPGDSGEKILLWMDTGSQTRVLVKEFDASALTSGPQFLDFTEALNASPIASLPGSSRKLFLTTTVAGQEYPLSMTSFPGACQVTYSTWDIDWYAGFPLYLAYPENGYGEMVGVASGYDPTLVYSEPLKCTGILIPDFTVNGGSFGGQQSKPYEPTPPPTNRITIITHGAGVVATSSPEGVAINDVQSLVNATNTYHFDMDTGGEIVITFSETTSTSMIDFKVNGVDTALHVITPPTPGVGGSGVYSYTIDDFTADIQLDYYSVPIDF